MSPYKINILGLLFYFIFKVRLQVNAKYLITPFSNDCSRSLIANALLRELLIPLQRGPLRGEAFCFSYMEDSVMNSFHQKNVPIKLTKLTLY